MSFAVDVRDLTVRYGRTTALDRVSLSLKPGRIYGLVGRNGSGKTSLLSTLAAFARPSAGTVRVDGEDPYENPRIMGATCLIRESGNFMDRKVAGVLRYWAGARPGWNMELAERLIDVFELPLNRSVSALSRGKRSALGIVAGLASRAPLTMFDEAHLGLDAPSRYAFYDALLADYAEQPRTIILSSHLIEEVERLFEHVIMLDGGRVVMDEDADTLRGRGTTVTGPERAVAAFTEGRKVLANRTLGPTAQATIYGELDGEAIAFAETESLALGPVPLQDLFVHLTARNTP